VGGARGGSAPLFRAILEPGHQPMRIREFAGLSDVGSVRENNEDRWFADPQAGLFLVADGLGGHAAGEVAAQRVVDQLPRLLESRRRALATREESPLARTLQAV